LRPSCSSLETEPTLTQGGRKAESGGPCGGGQFEHRISGSTDVRAGGGSATDTREQEPDRPRKRGPKRGPNPLSKTVPTGHTASHRARGTRRDETPGPARDFGVWRAKKMVDRGRIELPTPGFSVPVPCLSQRDVSRVEGETRERWVQGDLDSRARSFPAPKPAGLDLTRTTGTPQGRRVTQTAAKTAAWDPARGAYAAPTLIIRVGIVHEGRPAFLAEARTWPNKPLV
jgi:hypothetical protein